MRYVSTQIQKMADSYGAPEYIGNWGSDEGEGYIHIWMYPNGVLIGETNGDCVSHNDLGDKFPEQVADLHK